LGYLIYLQVPRNIFFNETLSGNDPAINAAVNDALGTMASLGAQIQDPADLPSAPELVTSNNETIVLRTDFKVDIEEYLRGLGGDPEEGVRTLEVSPSFPPLS
jgi:amidase